MAFWVAPVAIYCLWVSLGKIFRKTLYLDQTWHSYTFFAAKKAKRFGVKGGKW